MYVMSLDFADTKNNEKYVQENATQDERGLRLDF